MGLGHSPLSRAGLSIAALAVHPPARPCRGPTRALSPSEQRGTQGGSA